MSYEDNCRKKGKQLQYKMRQDSETLDTKVAVGKVKIYIGLFMNCRKY